MNSTETSFRFVRSINDSFTGFADIDIEENTNSLKQCVFQGLSPLDLSSSSLISDSLYSVSSLFLPSLNPALSHRVCFGLPALLIFCYNY